MVTPLSHLHRSPIFLMQSSVKVCGTILFCMNVSLQCQISSCELHIAYSLGTVQSILHVFVTGDGVTVYQGRGLYMRVVYILNVLVNHPVFWSPKCPEMVASCLFLFPWWTWCSYVCCLDTVETFIIRPFQGGQMTNVSSTCPYQQDGLLRVVFGEFKSLLRSCLQMLDCHNNDSYILFFLFTILVCS
jgi:hypothetical protein